MNHSKVIRRVHKVDFLEHLLDKDARPYVYIKQKRIHVEIIYPSHSVTFSFTQKVFEDIYYDAPAWVVTKHFNTEGIRYFINSQ